jgi:hypothetical protein
MQPRGRGKVKRRLRDVPLTPQEHGRASWDSLRAAGRRPRRKAPTENAHASSNKTARARAGERRVGSSARRRSVISILCERSGDRPASLWGPIGAAYDQTAFEADAALHRARARRGSGRARRAPAVPPEPDSPPMPADPAVPPAAQAHASSRGSPKHSTAMEAESAERSRSRTSRTSCGSCSNRTQMKRES